MKLHKTTFTIFLSLFFSYSNAENMSEFIAQISESSYNKKKYDLAITQAHEAFKLESENESAMWICAVSYLNMCEYTETIHYKKKLLQLKPNSVAYLSNLGGTYAQLGYDSLAIGLLNKALEIDPNYTSALNNRMAVHGFHYRHKEALKDAEYLLSLDPSSANGYRNLAILYLNMDEYDNALEAAEISEQLDPHCGQTPIVIESIKKKQDPKYKTSRETLEETLQLYTQTLKENRWDDDANFMRGKTYKRLGETDLAKKDFLFALELLNRTIEHFPDAWVKRRTRAEIYEELGLIDKAIEDYRIVLDQNPFDKGSKDDLEKLLQQ